MDFSRLDRNRVLVGGTASILLIISLFLLPWYSLEHTVSRTPSTSSYDPSAFVCGTGDFSCGGVGTFPVLRWFLLAGGPSPPILPPVILRGPKLSLVPRAMTKVVGLAVVVRV